MFIWTMFIRFPDDPVERQANRPAPLAPLPDPPPPPIGSPALHP